MNELQIFTYNDTTLRTVEMDGEMWWVLKDVCGVLGIVKPDNVAARLDDDEKGTCVVGTPGGKQNMTVVNEPGLYNVILRSDKPEAKDFKRWVTHEVLPSIRRTGSYQIAPRTPAELLAAQAQVLVDMERRLDRFETQTHALADKVDTAIKVFSRPAEDHWKSDVDSAIKELCEVNHLSVAKTKGFMYAELEQMTGCLVNSRLKRMQKRVRKTGARYKDAHALTKLDAVAADRQLRAVFEGIVRNWQARYAINAEYEEVEILEV